MEYRGLGDADAQFSVIRAVAMTRGEQNTEQLLKRHGLSPTQFALAFVNGRPFVPAI
jgi:aryl-alcohol dehydrogenase-like predicted oxidoreductase